jgi:RNA polymerase sigma-70 factor, ECF subfamily
VTVSHAISAPLGELRRSRADEVRMESVHAAHSRPLLRFLLGLTRNERQAAEDLLQETMLRVWRHMDSLPTGEESVRRWLFTIARRVAIDAARMRQVRPQEVSLLEAGHVAVDDTTNSALALQTVVDAFHRLSDDHRRVLTELYFKGSSVEEVSRQLSVPVGTVKSRAHYAMQSLRSAVTTVE